MITLLTLGQVIFQNFEIPERINFGGEQALAVKELVGGQRVVDAMGRRDDDISWSGLFFGEAAQYRAKFLDGMRVAGAKLPLTFSQFSYLVVIKEFKASFERFYQIPYDIKVTVVQDLNKPFPILIPASYDDAIANLTTEANDLALVANNSSINAALAALNIAINALPSLQNATNLQLSPIVSAAETLQAAIYVATTNLSNQTFNTTQTNQQKATDINQLSSMYSLASVIRQIQTNISLINTGSNGEIITVNSANLYQLAAEHYNDATQWTTIAEANGLYDPIVNAPDGISLIIPLKSIPSGGLLQ